MRLTISSVFQVAVVVLVLSFSWSYQRGNELIFIASASLAAFMYAALKTTLSLLTGAVFSLRSVALWQIHLQIQYASIAAIGIYLLTLADDLLAGSFSISPVVSIFIFSVFFGLFAIAISIVFALQGYLRNLRSFIYLCTTEILPALIVVGVFLK